MPIVVDFSELSHGNLGQPFFAEMARRLARSADNEDFVLVLKGPNLGGPSHRRASLGRKAGDHPMPPIDTTRNLIVRHWYCPDDLPKRQGLRERIPGLIKAALIASLRPCIVLTSDPGLSADLARMEDAGDAEASSERVVLVSNRSSLPMNGSSFDFDRLRFESEDIGGRIRKLVMVDGPCHAGDDADGVRVDKLVSALKASMTGRAPENETSLPPRKRLACFSPLPPVPSGISDYSDLLATELCEAYDVSVFVNQETVAEELRGRPYGILPIDRFFDLATSFDRIVYNFGNSPFHNHMLPILRLWPGVVDLHDFYLSDLLLSVAQTYPDERNDFGEQLFFSHGYRAVRATAKGTPSHILAQQLPSNREILDQAVGVIAHSDYALTLGRSFYGQASVSDWAVVPLARKQIERLTSEDVRSELGLAADDFVVCSFGFVSPNKLTDKLVDAWLGSSLATNARCKLFLVGDVTTMEFGVDLRQRLADLGESAGIIATGWCSTETYDAYLQAADLAVQLRTESRGETSAAILDCMSAGVPVIVNANGSAASLPADAVTLLADDFATEDLVGALEALFDDPQKARELGQRAFERIEKFHRIGPVAERYVAAVERFYRADHNAQNRLLDRLGRYKWKAISASDRSALTGAIANTFPSKSRKRQVFVDVSAICRRDIHTGIQRVVRAIAANWLADDLEELEITPVYVSQSTGHWAYHDARRWTSHLLGLSLESVDLLDDMPVDLIAGDILVVLDFTGPMLYEPNDRESLFSHIRDRGVFISSIVYDILPLKYPDMFPLIAAKHDKWLKTVGDVSHQVICISNAVADDVRSWFAENSSSATAHVDHFHLGADILNSNPTGGIEPKVTTAIQMLKAGTTFLMVGTVEPRKCQTQALDAFDLLWEKGQAVNLVIVGKLGWMSETLKDRIEQHDRLDRNLFWFNDISDESLLELYAAAECLIAASADEGFGLPLIEAAQKGLPILARDIPVFKEVAGEHAAYFDGQHGRDLAGAIERWCKALKTGDHIESGGMPWLSWKQSADILLGKVLASATARSD